MKLGLRTIGSWGMSVFALMVTALIGCNSCVDVRKATTFSNSALRQRELSEKSLIYHIVKRTVLISVQCRIIDNTTKKTVRGYKRVGWGTGAILFSSKDYSLIQTANHVVDVPKEIHGNQTLSCDKYVIEQKNSQNISINVYTGPVDKFIQDKTVDVAILKVYRNYGVRSRVASTSYLGQSVRVIGYPFLRAVEGVHLSYEKGFIATINIGPKATPDKQIRIGVGGYFGNSGGLVWNTSGEFVGTVVALTGFRTFGGYVPQQNTLYGAGLPSLHRFYRKHPILVRIMYGTP